MAASAAVRVPVVGNTLEHYMSTTEDVLSDYSGYPIVGTFPALGRTCLGIIQLTAAIALAFFFALAAPFSEEARKLLTRSLSHCAHGVGNILIGLFQAIPFSSLILKCSIGNPLPYTTSTMTSFKEDKTIEISTHYVSIREIEHVSDRYVPHADAPPPKAYAYHSGQEGKLLAYASIVEAEKMVLIEGQRYAWLTPEQALARGAQLDETYFTKSNWLVV